MYGKATKTPWRTKGQDDTHIVKQATSPGEIVSVDQLESPTPGFIAQLKGILTKERYHAATVFVDQYSRYTYIYLQRSLTSKETLEAKKAFERHCTDHDVHVTHYHADNGRFADNAFVNHAEQVKNQSLSYCGVGAHFQNGIAERSIRQLQDQARTMLLHANNKWPQAIAAHLWPYACRMAAHVHNLAPRDQDGETPASLFTRQTKPPKVRYNHTFGCPVYVLHRDLQGGKKINKWIERARVGINLGPSPKHASSVSLVLNPTTGLVSPQFHVKHDDFFETISDRSNRQHEDGLWKELAQLKTPTRRTINKRSNAQRKPQDITDSQEEHSFSHLKKLTRSRFTRENTPSKLRRSKRIQELNKRKRNESNRSDSTALSFAAQSDTDLRTHELFTEAAREQFDLQDQQLDPVAFATSADPDVMHLHQALGEPDRDKFIEAMDKEVQDHVKRGHWKIIHREEVPTDQRILDAVWSMRRKRRIATREVYRWKARLTVHGGQQQHGVNYWETYSPVVNWFSVRFFLTLAILHGWQTRQIDFVLAFPQAAVECDIYMKIPKGFDLGNDVNPDDYCLQLIKNLYGQKQAGRVWNQHLHQGLITMGFEQSSIDPCVYYKGTTVFLCYVDDSIIISPNADDIDATIKQLQVNYDVTDEGEIDDYLGVKIQRQGSNAITSHTAASHRKHPQGCPIGFTEDHYETVSSSDNRATSQGPRGRRPRRTMELKIGNREAQLPREVYKTGHSVRSSPMCSLLVQPQEVTYQGSSALVRLPSRHKRQGTPAHTHAQVHRMLGRFRLLRIMGQELGRV